MQVRPFVSLVVMLAVVATGATAADHTSTKGSSKSSTAATSKTASRDGWPDTREGAMGRAWTQAFSSGDSAFRRFLSEHQTPASLEKKSIDARMATYRENRERFGALTLGSVVRSSPGELVVSLLASDATAHEFTFQLETKPPHKLVVVSRKEMRRQGHGFGFHH